MGSFCAGHVGFETLKATRDLTEENEANNVHVPYFKPFVLYSFQIIEMTDSFHQGPK